MTYLVCLLLAVSATDPKTDDEKSLYAIGYLIGSRNLAQFQLKPDEMVFREAPSTLLNAAGEKITEWD